MAFKNLHTQNYQLHANPQDPRMVTRLVSKPDQADCILIGYPDDEGIQLNGGRVGAHQGPDEIRKAFYKMTTGQLPPFSIFDGGNIGNEISLKDRHSLAEEVLENYYRAGKFNLTLGGGHDYGYPDAQAFLNAYKASKKKPVVINFDAHLDVRPLDQGLTSGTPFYRLLLENPGQFHFFEVGIQEHCNSTHHVHWCQEQGGKILSLEHIRAKGLLKSLKNATTRFKGHPCFLSVDIDAFSSTEAPGCSQSWPTGLSSEEFFPAFDFLFQNFDVRGLGIYEVSPPLDLVPLTSRLAALILYRSLKNKKFRGSHEKKSARVRKRQS
jgi:formiminoglutamase